MSTPTPPSSPSPTHPQRLSHFRGRFLELASLNGWEFAHRIRGSTPVGIVAMTDEGKVILIAQFRVPVQRVCVEIPAGLVGDSDVHTDEDWKLAARRELEEETGYTASTFELLSEGPTSAGLSSELIKLVRASGLRKIGAPTPDGDEQITVHEVPLGQVPEFLAAQAAAGHLIDPKVYAALYFLVGR